MKYKYLNFNTHHFLAATLVFLVHFGWTQELIAPTAPSFFNTHPAELHTPDPLLLALSEKTPIASGNFKLEGGLFLNNLSEYQDPFHEFHIKIDFNKINESEIGETYYSVKELTSNKVMNLYSKNRTLFLTASSNRELIFTRGFKDAEINIMSNSGKTLSRIPLTMAFINPHDYFEGLYNENDKNLFLIGVNTIAMYSLVNKIFNVILKPNEGGQESAITTGTLLTSDYKRLLVRVVDYAQSPAESYVNIYDAKTGTLMGKVNSDAPKLLLTDPKHLLITVANERSVIDLDTLEQRKLSVPKNLGLSSAYVGPRNSLIFVDNSLGFFNYDISGNLLAKIAMPTVIEDIKPLDRGLRYFIKFKNVSGLFYFDLVKNEYIKYPIVLEPLARIFSKLHFARNKIYASSFSDLLSGVISIDTEKISQQEARNTYENLKSDSLLSIIRSKSLLWMSFIESSLRESVNSQISGISSNITDISNISLTRIPTAFQEEIKSEIKTFMNLFLAIDESAIRNGPNAVPLFLSYLSAFKPVLQKMNDKEKEFLIDLIVIKWTSALKISSKYNLIPSSKLANIYVSILKSYFYENSTETKRSDFVFTMEGDKTIPTILSTNPIIQSDTRFFSNSIGSSPDTSELTSGEARNEFGFYTKKLSPLVLELGKPSQHFEYQWNLDQKVVTASGDIRLVSLEHLVRQSNSINYRDLWKDGQLTGAVLISSNLGRSQDLLLMYINYFKKSGFKFPHYRFYWKNSFKESFFMPEPQNFKTSFKDWFQSEIESGKLDYWIKEAHAGGNDNVIFMNTQSRYIKGVRILENGKKEEVFLVFADLGINEIDLKKSQVSVENLDLEKWLRTREKNSPTELVYINASCWSSDKAKAEIIAANSPLLLEIPTNLSALTFTPKDDNHLQVLLTGIRQGLSFLDLKSRLDSIRRTDGITNPYIFPNEEIYNKSIWKNLTNTVDYSVSIKEQ